jgi:diguanylate cyclase (GGDEF)-like protein
VDSDQTAAEPDQTHAEQAPYRDEPARAGRAGRRIRSQTSIARALSSEATHLDSAARLAAADARDREADARDDRAATRDELAAALDAQLAALESPDVVDSNGTADLHRRLARGAERAAQARERAAEAREAAARDRAAARAERVRAAEDRRVLYAELELEGVDHLTGALLRRRGLDILQRELERTRRTSDRLTVAFIDVEGLKRVNDERGHDAGDAVLHEVARSISDMLRPYDSVMRYGGDEFVCVLSGQRLPDLRKRFEQVADDIAQRCNGTSITVGLAQARVEETPQQVIARADQTMFAIRATRPAGTGIWPPHARSR